jgi:hypothetical protein
MSLGLITPLRQRNTSLSPFPPFHSSFSKCCPRDRCPRNASVICGSATAKVLHRNLGPKENKSRSFCTPPIIEIIVASRFLVRNFLSLLAIDNHVSPQSQHSHGSSQKRTSALPRQSSSSSSCSCPSLDIRSSPSFTTHCNPNPNPNPNPNTISQAILHHASSAVWSSSSTAGTRIRP